MKKLIALLFFTGLFTGNGFSQNAAGNENLVKYRSFNSQLDAKSDTLHRRFFQKETIELEPNEMALIKYTSPEFAVSLFVRNSKGDTLGSVEIPRYFSSSGSFLTYLFKQSQGGTYQLLFTSKDTIEKGKFTVHIATYDKDKFEFDDDWEFCQKLDYLMQHSATDFQFVAGEKAKEFSLTNTRTTDDYLWTPSKCEIEYFTSDVYVCTLLENINLEKCIQKVKEIDYEIKKCISAEWKASERRREDVSEMNRPRFEKELDYKLLGKPIDDHNTFHEKFNLKYSIRLLIEKDLASGYDLKIILE